MMTRPAFILVCKRILLVQAFLFVSACGIVRHDAEIDQIRLAENSGVAQQLVRQQAMADLACPKVVTKVLSGTNTEGAPLGPVWRDFTIEATGCGNTRSYAIQCQGESTCFNKDRR